MIVSPVAFSSPPPPTLIPFSAPAHVVDRSECFDRHAADADLARGEIETSSVWPPGTAVSQLVADSAGELGIASFAVPSRSGAIFAAFVTSICSM